MTRATWATLRRDAVAGSLFSNTALLVITTTSVTSLATGEALSAVPVVTLVLALSLPRTRLGNFGGLLAVAIPSAIVALEHRSSSHAAWE